MNTSLAFLSYDTALAATSYRNFGIAILDGVIPKSLLEEWLQSINDHLDEFVLNTAIGSMGECGNYLVLDGIKTKKFLNKIDYHYDRCRELTTKVIAKKAIASPYELSSVNVKVYEEGGKQGLHFDSQPITCLVFLSEGSPLQLKVKGKWVDIEPIPGAMAIFNGREMPHRVLPVKENDIRVTIPMNYYFEDDLYRPEWLDDAIYQNKDY